MEIRVHSTDADSHSALERNVPQGVDVAQFTVPDTHPDAKWHDNRDEVHVAMTISESVDTIKSIFYVLLGIDARNAGKVTIS